MKQRKYLDPPLLDRVLVSLARVIGVAIVAFIVLLCLPFLHVSQNREEPSLPSSMTAEEPTRVGVKLRRGETLASVLSRFGVEPPSVRAIIEKVRVFVNPKSIRPGHDVQVVLSEDKTVQGLELIVDNNLVQVKATADGWLAERNAIPFVRDRRVIRGSIKESLYQSGVGAGLSPKHIVDVAKIFEYDIDFFSDFRRGDAFSFLVEELRYANGQRILGRILAAELESGDETFSTFHHVTRNGRGGYYDAEGRAARRFFLRAPLSYARISSPFSFARRHPIFRTVRPHMAIDYAAPQGTPVIAIGRGQVAFVGWRKGYGNVVDILHPGGYTSRYAHFSRFAKSLRKGTAVDAGEVIGYVGQTGHATGPHLHFEFLRGGEKLNFLGLRLPKNERLAGEEQRRFQQLRMEREALLRRADDQVVDSASRASEVVLR